MFLLTTVSMPWRRALEIISANCSPRCAAWPTLLAEIGVAAWIALFRDGVQPLLAMAQQVTLRKGLALPLPLLGLEKAMLVSL